MLSNVIYNVGQKVAQNNYGQKFLSQIIYMQGCTYKCSKTQQKWKQPKHYSSMHHLHGLVQYTNYMCNKCRVIFLHVLVPVCFLYYSQQHSYMQSIFIKKTLTLVCITSAKAIQYEYINFSMCCTTSHLCLHPHEKCSYSDLDCQRSHLQVLEVST